MGKAHFDQMCRDAIAVDCAALPLAVQLFGATSQAEQHLFGCGIWDKMSVDHRVNTARKLVHLRIQFSTRLKQMLLEGGITIMARDMQTGEMVRVQDPDVIDFDDPVVPLADFPVALISVQ